jgi:glycosyltransferase involved in cell wall biosynthesis
MDKPVKDKLSNRLCYRHASARIAISTPIKDKLEVEEWGEVKIIADAFPKHTLLPEVTQAFREEFRGKFLVGHAGALVDRTKGQRVLLEAAKLLEKEFPSMHFVFLGDGKDRAILQKETAALSNITWLGFKDNIGDYLAGLDVFAFPSRNEGLGSVILEAMYIGVPVVASDVGGIPDIVRHEETGLLFTSGSAHQLADRLRILYSSAELRKILQVKAYAQVKEYVPEKMARKYLDIYQSFLKNSPR